MTNNHLTYFKVENFKKFDSLEVKDIGQFNLIVGDNNVGKTCFLEALLFDEDESQLLNNFYIGLTKRGLKFQIQEVTVKTGNTAKTETIYPKENYFNLFLNKSTDENLVFRYTSKENKSEIKINVTSENKILNAVNPVIGLDISMQSEDDKKIKYLFDTKKITFDDFKKQFIDINKSNASISSSWIYGYNLDILNFPLVSFNDTPLDEESRSMYEILKTKREKQILIDALKVVHPNIVDIELRENFEDLKAVFLISFEDKDEFVPLNFLGDGFKRIFYIVLKALSLKGKRILIDEFEIGIHYSKMKDFWINILKVCKELDVQLFATTHSEECTQAFVSASNSLENTDDIRLIKLEESTNKEKIYASTFTYNQIIAGLDSNVELRG